MNILLTCAISSTPLGILATAFPSSFTNTSAVHPAFSTGLTTNAKTLLDSSRMGTLESIESRLAFLATIHRLTAVTQDFPGLPSELLVSQFTPDLLTLVDWKLRVPSIFYPALHISKANAGFDCLENWILTGLEVRDSAKIKLADAESKLLTDLENSRNAIALSGDPSPTRLYNWVASLLLGTPYEPDSKGWLRTLFLAKDATAILYFDRTEIILACEIIEAALPLGTGLGPSVRRRLAILKDTIGGYYVDVDELDRNMETESMEAFNARQTMRTETLANAIADAPTKEPNRADFPDQLAFIRARAKWSLACKTAK